MLAQAAIGNPVLVVEQLTVGHDHEVVLRGVSFSVDREEIFLVLGESGCGKSTLLKTILGLERPRSGRIEVAGVEIGSADIEQLARLHRQIGVLFQSDALFGSMTLFENVALPLRRHTDLPEDLIHDLVRTRLGMVQLNGYENHLPAELSGGMRKRAALARAAVLDPAILFLDEPLAGLDPVTAAEIDRLIRELNEGMGTTFVIVTQNLASVLEIGSRAIVIDREERGIIAEGDPRRLKEESDDERVIRFFHRRPREERPADRRPRDGDR